MILFDRYAKLKKQLAGAAVHSAPKEMLPLLSGTLLKNDMPELIVEPSSVEDLQAVIRFANEKELRIAVAAGQHPVCVQNLERTILLLTHRLSGPSRMTQDGLGIWAGSGTPLEALTVDLAQRGLTWPPLHPITPGETLGTLFANGLEGLRCHNAGGVLANLRAVEWVGYDGEQYLTGPGVGGDSLDLSGLLFGGGARYGVFTRFELALRKAPATRALATYQCETLEQVHELFQALRYSKPEPSALTVWLRAATNGLRQGNDHLVSDGANVLLAAEWESAVEVRSLPEVECKVATEAADVNRVWQNLLRLPRTLARLFPHHTVGRFRIPSESLPDFSERVEELGRDRSLTVAVWGTLDHGYLHAWVLRPDDEARTARRAAEVLERLTEDALNLGGVPLENAAGLVNLSPFRDVQTQSWELELQAKCDPGSRYRPLRGVAQAA